MTRRRTAWKPLRAEAVSLLALAGPLGTTGVAQAKAAEDSAVAEEIRQLELHLADLLRSGAYDEYEEYLTADYVRTTAGRLQTREQVLAGFRADPSALVEITPEDLEVRVHGEAAVLTGRLRTAREKDGRLIRSASRFTKTFVRERGAWRLAALHGSPLAEEEGR